MLKFFFGLFILFTLSGQTAPLTVWVELYPPFGYLKDKKIVGLSTEVAQRIINEARIKVKSWETARWARAFHEAKSKPNTMLYTVVRKPDRENLFHWIGPVSGRKIYLYKLKKRTDINLKTIEDAKKYLVGGVNKTAASEYLISKGIRPKLVPSYRQTLLKLKTGRIDLANFLDYSLVFLSKKEGIDPTLFEKELLIDGSRDYYIVLNKNTHQNTISKLKSAFNHLKSSGELEKIQRKYLR